MENTTVSDLQALRAAMDERDLVPRGEPARVVQLGRSYAASRSARLPRVDRWSETVLGQRTLRVARAYLAGQLQQVLADLEATSCGKTASVDSNGGGAFASSPPKSGDVDPPHVRYRAEWESIRGKAQGRLGLASDDIAIRAVLNRARRETEALLARARDELDAILHTRAGEASETEQQRTRRLLVKAGFPAGEVASDMRLTEAQVRRTRIQHGRDPELGEIDLGRKVSAEMIEPDERRRLARELADRYGLSSHGIAPLIGVSQMQAWRDLKATETAERRAA